MNNSEEINARMENIYQNTPEDDIPWNRTDPPSLLVELINSGKILPCKAIDIGCGTGNYSLFLANNGFAVNGVDVSKTAVQLARKKALQQNSTARFVAVNMLGDISILDGQFEFIHEWMVLHHILPPDRKTYLQNITSLISPGGKYLSISFSEADKQFGDPPEGKIRKSPIGPTVYFAEIDELAEFFVPEFKILNKKITKIPGKTGEHTVNYLLMEKVAKP